MSVYDFCGTWEERRDGSKSLEELLRAMRVRDSKIQESLNASTTQRIWVKGQTLVTAYSNELGDVASSYALNGGWRVSSKHNNAKQMVSRCTYDATARTLVIEKKLQKQGGVLRDSRRVERDNDGTILMTQRLEFVPLRKQQKQEQEDGTTTTIVTSSSIVASRMWKRICKAPVDVLLDRLRGVWVIDEDASDSLRPIFEAMNLPPTKIRSALAQKTQHSIILSGPRELLFVHQSVHGDVKSTTHAVRTDVDTNRPLPVPDKGQMACFCTSDHSITVVSTSEDGSSSNCDERNLTLDGTVVNQQISFTALGAAESIVVNRRWIRAPSHTASWEETIPLALHLDENAPLLPPALRSIASSSAVQTTVEVVAPSREVEVVLLSSTADSAGSKLDQSVIVSTTSGEDLEVGMAELRTGNASSTGLYAVLIVCLVLATLARPILGDFLVAVLVLPLYGYLRYRAPIGKEAMDLFTPWVRTVLLLLATTIIAFFPHSDNSSDAGADFGEAVVVLILLCLFGVSRFFAETRTTFMVTQADQWVAVGVSFACSTLAWFHGFPHLVRGDDENEPALAPLLCFFLIATFALRSYAARGPPPSRSEITEVDSNIKSVFEINVDEYRVNPAGSFGEYQVCIQSSKGTFKTWQRYSAFVALKNELGLKSCELPPKRVFWSTSDAIMDERKQGLDAFMKRLIEECGGEDFFESNHSLRMFVGAPPPS